jgi:hypothetical protein
VTSGNNAVSGVAATYLRDARYSRYTRALTFQILS